MKIANIYRLKVNNRGTRITNQICSKLTVKLSEQWFWAFIFFLCVTIFIFQSFLDLIFSSWYLIFDSFMLFRKDLHKVEFTGGKFKTIEWKMHLSKISMVNLKSWSNYLDTYWIMFIKGRCCTFVIASPRPSYSLMILVQNFMLIKSHIETWVWKSTELKIFIFKVL